MKSKRLLVSLLEYIDLFEATVPEAEDMELEAFIAFTACMLAQQKTQTDAPSMPEADIARLLSLLHRLSRSYIKEALSASACLQTEEEYTYLICLLTSNGLSKTELYTRNAMERSSGAEIIRRLRQHKLIEERPDPDDRRSIRIYITSKGREELMKILPRLRVAAKVLAAPLEQEQQVLLHYLLQTLYEGQKPVGRGLVE